LKALGVVLRNHAQRLQGDSEFNRNQGPNVHAANPVSSLDTRIFRKAFSNSLPLPAATDPHFEGAIRSVLGNPGSLVRPRLIDEMAAAYGLPAPNAEQIAVALEYFHTASLLFDDLPCMDNALERRGAPCAHLLFGEEGAILTALALINRAYALIWRAVSGASPSRQVPALAFIEQCLGVEGLLNGQSLDLHFSALPRTCQATEHVARGKTVSLVRLTLVLPAMLGGARARELQLIERISLFWGLSYQTVDDLKDVLQSAAQTGKTSSRDALLGRPNLASVIGIEAAVERLRRLLRLGDKALGALLMLRPELNLLQKLRVRLEEELAEIMNDSGALLETAAR
jgi:geranylgeranyl pyrophosphate synthase